MWVRWWSSVGVVGLAEMPRNPSHVSRPGNGRPDGPAVSKGGLIRLPVGCALCRVLLIYGCAALFSSCLRGCLPSYLPTLRNQHLSDRETDRETDLLDALERSARQSTWGRLNTGPAFRKASQKS